MRHSEGTPEGGRVTETPADGDLVHGCRLPQRFRGVPADELQPLVADPRGDGDSVFVFLEQPVKVADRDVVHRRDDY
jgi:hypothetical protein